MFVIVKVMTATAAAIRISFNIGRKDVINDSNIWLKVELDDLNVGLTELTGGILLPTSY